MKISNALFFVLLSLHVFSQENIKRCQTFEVLQNLEQQHPGYMGKVNACFDNAKQLAAQMKLNRATDDTVYKVRLVFHVVYGAAIENIPDSVIYAQVRILNEDYRRRNADTVKTRSEFLPIVGDSKIEFELATVDPDGNPTTGITRTVGNGGIIGYNPFTEDVKKEPGGKAPWPTDRYVNVWVCNLFLGIVLGYAHPPDNAPNWDAAQFADSANQGVVLHYAAVGNNFSQPIDPTVAGGRSLTHEMGHYLGLRHIWGDSTGCNNDDGIDDTPFASDQQQQTCDTVINSCPDAPFDFRDMTENYMDYSDDRCINAFTVGQIDIMRAMLRTSRAGVATAAFPTGLGNAEKDLELLEIYPNPSTGVVYLNVQVNDGKSYSYEVYNSIGEKLFGETEIGSFVRSRIVYLNNQPAGIYFLKFVAGGQRIIKKIQLVK